MTVEISEIIRNGIIFDAKNWTRLMSISDNSLHSIEMLFDTLKEREINYLLVGGVALLSYVEGRNTQDIDLILARSDLDTLPEVDIIEENKEFIRGSFNDLQVDILLTRNGVFRKILNDFTNDRAFGDHSIRCATVEGLLILKLYALPSLYRQGDFSRASIYENDVLLLLLNYAVNMEEILKILSSHLLVSDLNEVRSIVVDIQARIKRFSAQQQALGEE